MKSKKLIAALLTLVMVFPSLASASDNDKSIYYEYMSKYTGVSVSELQDIESKYGDLSKYYNVEMPSEKLNLTSEYRESNSINDIFVNKDEPGLLAATAEDVGYYESLSAYTEIPVSKLKELEEEYGDLNKYLGLPTVKNTNLIQQNNGFVLNSDDDGDKKMTSADWTYMKGRADKGDILISKDQTTYVLWIIGVNHGHAGIVYTDSSRTVEALGDPHKSGDYDISRWANRYTMRDYYPTGVKSYREKAADYAYKNLKGKPYKATASRTSTEYLQCANLVWQAYKSQNTELNYAPAGWATPMTLLEDSNLTLWAGVNWSTGDHTW